MERDHYPVWQRRQMARLAAQGATIDCNLDGFRVRRGQHSVWCPRDPRPGAIYDIPTTAGASTVTLPANALEGTEVTFVADGTKNGHTVQYRDATGPTNLTTALTLSKRHLVRCAFLNGKWVANAYVAP
jgi:hypothetical protein